MKLKQEYMPMYTLMAIYLTFICFQGLQLDIHSLKIQEGFGFGFLFSLALIPISIIIWIYNMKVNKIVFKLKLKTIRSRILAILVAISLVTIFYITFLQLNNVYTGGIYNNVDKLQHEARFYIVLDDKNIRCTENEYDLIDKNQKYMIKYRWNKYISSYTKLIRISLIE